MQTPESIRAAAAALDALLERGDVEGVTACFAPDCTIEVLGVRLRGRGGARRWLRWLFGHVEGLRFEPALITVQDDLLVEEFLVQARLRTGGVARSRQAEVLRYRDDLVVDLRLYFDPLDFLEAEGPLGRAVAPAARRFARRALAPFEVLDAPRR